MSIATLFILFGAKDEYISFLSVRSSYVRFTGSFCRHVNSGWSSRPSYTTVLSIPGDLPEKDLNGIKEKVAKKQNSVLITLEELKKNKQKHLSAKILKNFYPSTNVVDRFVLMLEKHPGAPFALVFNGGVAVTNNDCLHADKLYEIYKSDPKKYEAMHSANARNRDPIHPENHFGPLGIK